MHRLYTRLCAMVVQVGTLVLLLAVIEGCASRRGVTPDPFQLSRPLPVAVKQDAWPGIVKTLLQEGEVIETAHRPLSWASFHRPLAEATFRQLCDVQTTTIVNVDSWKFKAGIINIAVWVEEEGTAEAPPHLQMEGQCSVTFVPPGWQGALIGGHPLGIITGPLFGPTMFPRTAVLASTGQLERELQAKILTTLGVDLPPWLVKPQ